jgi:hypothetical protein
MRPHHTMRHCILTLNHSSARGLERLPLERCDVGSELTAPEAILVRSTDMQRMRIPLSVLAIARAQRILARPHTAVEPDLAAAFEGIPVQKWGLPRRMAAMRPLERRAKLTAVDNDFASGHVSAGVRGERQ